MISLIRIAPIRPCCRAMPDYNTAVCIHHIHCIYELYIWFHISIHDAAKLASHVCHFASCHMYSYTHTIPVMT